MCARSVLVVPAVVSLLVLGGVTGAFAAAPPPPSVGTLTIAETPVYSQTSYVGRVQSETIVNLQARVTGYLEQQDFTEGGEVKAGQVLYVIEQPPYQAAVAQAQAAVAQAQAQEVNANITLRRAESLLHTPAGQQSMVDDARATADADAAAVQAAQAQLENAQINLNYTEIKAPFTGRIGQSLVDVGNVVGPTSGTLATIVSEDPMYVLFSVPVRDALQLRAHLASQGGFSALNVHLILPDGRTYDQTGKIDFLNNSVTQNTDTLTLRATLPNPPIPGMPANGIANRELENGEFITVVLRDSKPQDRIVIPYGAVLSDQFGNFVLTVGPGNKVARQNVTLGQTTDTTAVVTKGLKAGERVIIDGLQRVHPGLVVAPEAEAVNLTNGGQSGTVAGSPG